MLADLVCETTFAFDFFASVGVQLISSNAINPCDFRLAGLIDLETLADVDLVLSFNFALVAEGLMASLFTLATTVEFMFALIFDVLARVVCTTLLLGMAGVFN